MAEITITKVEYELLTRQSEQIRIIERFLLEHPYPSVDDIRLIMGVPEKKKEVDVKEVFD